MKAFTVLFFCSLSISSIASDERDWHGGTFIGGGDTQDCTVPVAFADRSSMEAFASSRPWIDLTFFCQDSQEVAAMVITYPTGGTTWKEVILFRRRFDCWATLLTRADIKSDVCVTSSGDDLMVSLVDDQTILVRLPWKSMSK